MSATYRFSGIVVLFHCLTFNSVRAEITVSSWWLNTGTWSDLGRTQLVVEDEATLPFNVERTAADGQSTSTTRYDFSYDPLVNESLAIFNFEFDHDPGNQVGCGAGSAGEIYFSVSEALPYSFEGAYTANGGDSVTFLASLWNDTTGDPVFVHLQERDGASDWMLTIGEEVEPGIFYGQPLGTLLPGYEYALCHSLGVTEAYPGSTSASGFLEFVIPEPTGLSLLGLGGLALPRRKPS